MKKFLLICMALMLVCLPCSAAEWADGLGPQKPYSNNPEVDFSETIGYMMLSPLPGSTAKPGTAQLRLYLPREDVQVGAGTLYLDSEEDGRVSEVTVGAETMTRRAMTEEELDLLLWGCGTVFEVELPQPLDANRHYIVQMTEGCIAAPDYENASPAIAGKNAWTFDTVAKNGVEGLTYFHAPVDALDPVKLGEGEAVKAGDFATFKVVMGEAVTASIYCDEGEMEATESFFEADGETRVTFPATGEVTWGVVFVDADGEVTDAVEFHTTVEE